MREPLSFTAKREVSEELPTSPVAATEPARLSLLVVAIDRELGQSVRDGIDPRQFTCAHAGTPETARRPLEHEEPDVVLLDCALGQQALTLVDEIVERHPRTQVVALAGFSTAAIAMEAMRRGAGDYLTTPFSAEELAAALERVRLRVRRDAESRKLRERLRTGHGMGPLVGAAPPMEKLYRILSKLALSQHPALLLGESGTGKELVARCIHEFGINGARPFVVVDCAAITEAALVTGKRAKDNLLSAAGDGTIFFDEIGDLPLGLQSLLVRVIQDRQIRTGAVPSRAFTARVLAGSTRDLAAMVDQGMFRRDLYLRLNVVKLTIPPLRERREDIPMLAQQFIQALGAPGDYTLSDEALRLLCEYDWPGNVSELRTALGRMVALSSGPVLHAVDVTSQLREFQAHQQATAAFAAATAEDERAADDAVVTLAQMEKQAILSTIRQLNGDKLTAARLLGIGKTTLYRKLKEYGTAV